MPADWIVPLLVTSASAVATTTAGAPPVALMLPVAPTIRDEPVPVTVTTVPLFEAAPVRVTSAPLLTVVPADWVRVPPSVRLPPETIRLPAPPAPPL